MIPFNQKELQKELSVLNRLVLQLNTLLKEKVTKQMDKCVTLAKREPKQSCMEKRRGQTNKKDSKRSKAASRSKGTKVPRFTLEDGQKTRLKDIKLPASYGQEKVVKIGKSKAKV